MKRVFSLGELARRVEGRVVGDAGRMLSGVETLEAAGPDQLSFLASAKYRPAAAESEAGAIIVTPGTKLAGRDLLEVADPYLALAEILEMYYPPAAIRPGVSPDARIASGARLGADVEVGPFAVLADGVVVGDRVRIGAGTVLGEDCEVGPESILHPRVVLYPGTRLGRRCVVHSGAVLGADGFGLATRADGSHRKIPQVGRVVVGDDVEIGANTTIDRAALGETLIGEGSRLDNLVMIGHGAKLGRDVVLVAQSGVAGSTRLGDRVTIAAQSGAVGHLDVPDGLTLAAKSAILSKPEPGAKLLAGVPAVEIREWRKSQAVVRRLPDLRAELRRVSARLAAIEARLASDGER